MPGSAFDGQDRSLGVVGKASIVDLLWPGECQDQEQQTDDGQRQRQQNDDGVSGGDMVMQSEFQQQLGEVAPSGETRRLSSMAVQPPEAMSVYGVDEIESLKMKLDTFHHEFQHKLYNIYQKTNILQHQHDTAAQAEVKVISTSTTAKWWKPLAVISLLLAVIGTAVIATILLLLATTSFSMEVPGESPVTPNSNEFFAKLNSSNCVLDDDYWDGYNIENLAKACELYFGSNTSVSELVGPVNLEVSHATLPQTRKREDPRN